MVDQALIYGGFPYAPELFRYWASQMLLKHLQPLMHRALVRSETAPTPALERCLVHIDLCELPAVRSSQQAA